MKDLAGGTPGPGTQLASRAASPVSAGSAVGPCSPLSPEDDREAAIYVAHLRAQAEAALPDAGMPAQLAAAWLAAHIAVTGTRRWRGRIVGAAISDVYLGSWSVAAHTRRSAPDPLNLPRQAQLAEEGRELLALAAPFREQTREVTEKDGGLVSPAATRRMRRAIGTVPGAEALVRFAIIALAAHCHPHKRAELALSDQFGNRIEIVLRCRPSLQEAMQAAAAAVFGRMARIRALRHLAVRARSLLSASSSSSGY